MLNRGAHLRREAGVAGPELASFVDAYNALTWTIADLPHVGGCEATPGRLLQIAAAL